MDNNTTSGTRGGKLYFPSFLFISFEIRLLIEKIWLKEKENQEILSSMDIEGKMLK